MLSIQEEKQCRLLTISDSGSLRCIGFSGFWGRLSDAIFGVICCEPLDYPIV
jgi:hypothetical protein